MYEIWVHEDDYDQYGNEVHYMFKCPCCRSKDYKEAFKIMISNVMHSNVMEQGEDFINPHKPIVDLYKIIWDQIYHERRIELDEMKRLRLIEYY